LPRVAVVGVGQRLRGDDGAGPAVARRLAALAGASLQVVDAGHAPENCLGPIVRFGPDAILFVDAACGGLAPGELTWLRPDEADSRGGSTHTLSLAMLAAYLSAETGAAVHVLGIEPGEMAFGEGLSPVVEETVAQAAATFTDYWRKLNTACSAMASGEASVVNT
jgi:hydrogenase 3 maturation protease